MMRGWFFPLLPGVCLALALLEADSVLIGQWMISRPILLGPALGFYFGQPWLGMVLGTVNELFAFDEKPMGSVVPLNSSIAAACSVLLSVGPFRVPLAVAFPAGLALGLGHKWVETGIRSLRNGLTRKAERSLADEGRVPWGRILAASIVLHVAATALFLFFGLALCGPLLRWAWSGAPLAVRIPAASAFAAAPWVGLAALIHSLARKS